MSTVRRGDGWREYSGLADLLSMVMGSTHCRDVEWLAELWSLRKSQFSRLRDLVVAFFRIDEVGPWQRMTGLVIYGVISVGSDCLVLALLRIKNLTTARLERPRGNLSWIMRRWLSSWLWNRWIHNNLLLRRRQFRYLSSVVWTLNLSLPPTCLYCILFHITFGNFLGHW